MRFVADGMLGKLTRWLRMLGQDVNYSNNAEDSQLLEIAKVEGRILLTRDFQLYQRAVTKEIDAFYLEGQVEEERLAEMADRFQIELEIDMATSRCPKCNASLKQIDKEAVAAEVEKNSLDNYQEFWKCSKCGKIYWQGSHWIKIRSMLQKAKEIQKTIKKE